MSEEKDKKKKPGIIRLTLGAIGLFIVLLIAISVLSSVEPHNYMPKESINEVLQNVNQEPQKVLMQEENDKKAGNSNE